MAGLLTNANYINDTIKPAIKSAIEAQGVTVPSTDSFLDYADRIAEIEGGGDGYVLKDLPTGSISTVTDAAPLPLNALKVSIEAVQSGSGTPSPSNPRPITGWDSVEITVCDDINNPTQTQTTTIPISSTCYGGELDVGSGEGTKWQYYNLDSFTFVEESQYGYYWIVNAAIPFAQNREIGDCSHFEVGEQNDMFVGTGTNTGHYILFRKNKVDAELGISSVAEFNAYLQSQKNNGTPVQLVYLLATPTTTQLAQPTAIRTLDGVNNIWADCGDVLDGEYFSGSAPKLSKVDYSIGSGSQPMLSDGRYLSGFASMAGYGAFPRDDSGNWLDVDWSDDFEIGARFKASAFPSSGNTTIFGSGVSGSMTYAPDVYFWNGSTAYITLSTDGSTSAVDTALNYTFQTDTWYFVRLKFTLSTLNLKIEVSTDMENFTTAYNGTLASVPYHSSASICIGGMAQSSNYASNNIVVDTFNTYIKDDSGSIVWGAYKGA